MFNVSVKDQERPSERDMLEQIKTLDPVVWKEVSEIIALLEQWGVRSYTLTGYAEDPIITSYSIK